MCTRSPFHEGAAAIHSRGLYNLGSPKQLANGGHALNIDNRVAVTPLRSYMPLSGNMLPAQQPLFPAAAGSYPRMNVVDQRVATYEATKIGPEDPYRGWIKLAGV